MGLQARNLSDTSLVLRISIEMAAFSLENSTTNAAISIEIRSNQNVVVGILCECTGARWSPSGPILL